MSRRPKLVYFLLLFVFFKANGQFIENKGQWPEEFRYVAHFSGGEFLIQEQGISYIFMDASKYHRKHLEPTHIDDRTLIASNDSKSYDNGMIPAHRVDVKFLGSNSDVRIRPDGARQIRYNYFIGNERSRWASKVKSYKVVNFGNLYDNIDLYFLETGGGARYDIIVNPGGDPGQVQFKYEGATDLKISEGRLTIETTLGTVTEDRPYAFQLIGNRKKEVACHFRLQGDIVSFEFPEGYDPQYKLVIDPLLIFSTYSGSEADNWGNTACFDDRGNLYSGGIANHFRADFLGPFPATPGAFQTFWGGLWDSAIFKMDSTGTEMIYATYLGGIGSEVPHSTIVNNKGELVILGTTSSFDFPVTTGAFDQSFNGGSPITPIGIPHVNGTDIYVAKLSADGSQLVASTFIGGTANDGLSPNPESILVKNYGDEMRGDVIVDDNDDIYFTLPASSVDFFQVSVPENTFNDTYGGGVTDAVVIKMSDDLTRMIWGGYLGGSDLDASYSIKLDQQNSVFVAGGTTSTDFPMPPGGINETYNDEIDGWVINVDPTGTSIVSGTFLGTDRYDQVYFLDIDANDDIYALGQTLGNYPVTPGVYTVDKSMQFIHKLDHSLSQTLYSTVFGSGKGVPNMSPTAFLVNECNSLYISGWGAEFATFQTPPYLGLNIRDMPTSPNAFRTSTEGTDFYLIVLSEDATEFQYGTYYGGSGAMVHVDGGTSRFDKRGIVYHSVCASCFEELSTLETTDGAWAEVKGNEGEAACNNAVFKFDLSNLRAIFETNTVEFDTPGFSVGCIPQTVAFENRSLGGEILQWDFGDGGTRLTIPHPELPVDTVHHTFTEPGEYRVKLTAIDENTCAVTSEAFGTVTIGEPQFEIIDDLEVCIGEQAQLSASGGISYEWTPPETLNNALIPDPVASPDMTTTYTLMALDAFGCTFEDSVTVAINPLEGVGINYDIVNSCIDRSQIVLTFDGVGADSLVWDLGDGNMGTGDSLIYSYQEDGLYDINLTAISNECQESFDLSLFVGTIEVPNVFTPNDDGINDFFEVRSEVDVQLAIYNRWGKQLYASDNYQNDWRGEGLAAGIYFYELLLPDKSICNGWVHLLK